MYLADKKIIIDKHLIFGPVKKAFTYTQPPNNTILVANLKNDALYRFFDISAAKIQPDLQPDFLIYQNCFNALWAELNDIKNPNARIDTLLQFSEMYLKPQSALAQQMTQSFPPNINPVKKIALIAHQSERNIQINHKKQFGYSAKEIARYERFSKALQLTNTAINHRKPDWHEIVSKCGYYDQSQLIHDFRYYLNTTPSKYMKAHQHFCTPKI